MMHLNLKLLLLLLSLLLLFLLLFLIELLGETRIIRIIILIISAGTPLVSHSFNLNWKPKCIDPKIQYILDSS